ncbi:MATE family efflux transporter [Chryseobacterium caseinilyticum]|uniref:Polysaccharide biosynthesis C-terminal domain-containing protein n=1 Tax=Chryseobacterium caseinilyticum TaxID=2771428 RepID=A0ABR8ZDA9_9FLAO|nr:polysaccharide biosynthesis C-terminal domain-containing protein [Chryseobacterium caseinilyticum]MBD8083285.1 polysaccharide biosynthesis C-terminal domain-containing protein [Chryseobacterium caseinilyticum]
MLTILKTFVSRFLILILSFGLVIFSTQFWGSEGKGTISIVIANAAIVGFFSSIFAGSSTSYFASKFKTEQILVYSYLWSILTGIAVPLLFLFSKIQSAYLFHLIGISIFSALLSVNVNLFIGMRNIKMFNIYTVLQQLLHVVFLFGFIFILNLKEVSTYFTAQTFCLAFLFLISFFQIIKKCKSSNFKFSSEVFRNMFDYGWKNQFSALIQFLNYRLSFYFLEHYEGISTVGIFSVGITFAEAIWTITRSIAVVLYSEVINSKSRDESILKTKHSLKLSFSLMMIFILGIIVIPASVYELIFGSAFRRTKEIMLILSLGIFAIAVSDMVGYYFSGIKELKILNIKSIIGLAVTIFLSVILIPEYGIYGAGIATVASYCVSASILFYHFYRSTTFDVKDFLISKSDWNDIKSKFLKK